MLLPALNKARGKAKDIKCSANMKQLGFAWISYADEANGKLCPSTSVSGGTTTYWTQLLAAKIGESDKFAQISSLQWKRGGLLDCPSAPGTTADYANQMAGYPWYGMSAYLGGMWRNGVLDYASYGAAYAGPPIMFRFHISELKSPSKTTAFADCYMWGGANNRGYFYVRGISINPALKGYMQPRHSNNSIINTAFADGHVAGLTYSYYLICGDKVDKEPWCAGRGY